MPVISVAMMTNRLQLHDRNPAVIHRRRSQEFFISLSSSLNAIVE